MHDTVKRYEDIINTFKEKLEDQKIKKFPKIIAVSKTFKLEKILPLISYGHLEFGENKVQEAVEKWTDIKLKNQKIKLHLIGKLQTNKVKFVLKIFDYIHSVDSKKLAKKIADEQTKHNKNINIFIQVNLGNENQKSGVKKNELDSLFSYCKEIGLNVIGLMCIPPVNFDPVPFFKELKDLNDNLNLSDLSMGMSSDYEEAIENFSTYLRIGSEIFGKRD